MVLQEIKEKNRPSQDQHLAFDSQLVIEKKYFLISEGF